jgi:hypothetical protein
MLLRRCLPSTDRLTSSSARQTVFQQLIVFSKDCSSQLQSFPARRLGRRAPSKVIATTPEGFLQSTARGTVSAIATISPGSSLVLASVAWADGESSQVNVANLELQPGNPPL